MASLQELETALRAADAAGDTEGARVLASAYSEAKNAAPAADAGPSMVSRAYRAVNHLIPGGAVLNALGSGEPLQDLKDTAGGLVRGAGSLGATIVGKGGDLLFGKRTQSLSQLVKDEKPISRSDEIRTGMDEGLRTLGVDTAAPLFSGGKIMGEIAGTAGVPGALAKPVIALGKAIPSIARFAAPVAEALGSAGMKTGLNPSGVLNAGRAVDTGLRMGAGAAVSGASAAAVNPDDFWAGAGIGALLPPGLQLAAKAGGGIANGARRMMAGDAPRDAAAFVKAGDIAPDAINDVRGALAQQGPRIVQAPQSAAQILQEPGISQLDRVLRNSGAKPLIALDATQNAARMAAVERVAPTAGTLNEAAQDFGNIAGKEIVAGDAAARKATSKAFQNVDPFGEVRVTLPLAEMEAQQAKYLGRGTFGMGADAAAAVKTARAIGTEELPAITATKVPIRQGEDIVSAIKALGGIKQDSTSARNLAGEIRDLKQSNGMRAIIQNGRGQSPDTLAQAMHARGFIEDADPATLLNALRAHAGGDKVFAVGSDRGGAMQAGLEAAMGEAPAAGAVARPVPWEELQRLRSSISKSARDIEAAGGATPESSALRGMQGSLDERVKALADGKGASGDYFPADSVKAWKEARDLKQAQIATFRTGPQASLFRRGADNQAAIQGAEIAPKFFNQLGSQADDIAAFGRVASDGSRDALKSYATTGLAGTADRFGTLTNAKYNNWLKARSGAVEGLFDKGERAQLQGVGTDLRRADLGESIGKAKNQSATAQNVEAALQMGTVNPALLKAVGGRVPFIGKYAGALADSMAKTSREARIQRLGELMADPEKLAAALAQYQRLQQPLGLAGSSSLAPMIGIAAPRLMLGQ